MSFDARLKRQVQDRLDGYKEHICNGSCKNYEEYRELCGKIFEANQLLNEINKAIKADIAADDEGYEDLIPGTPNQLGGMDQNDPWDEKDTTH